MKILKKKINNKIVFIGDTNSINIEIIAKSFNSLKNKVNYLIIGSEFKIKKYLEKIQSDLKINSIMDPFNFNSIKSNSLNIYDISFKKNKFQELKTQINFCNFIANITKYDLVTMPIDKSVFKKKINFIGMTEYLGELNKQNTIMLMKGESFSVIPITTHISPKFIHKNIDKKKIISFLNKLNKFKKYEEITKYKSIKFLCYNPHCGEENTIGTEDNIIKKILKKRTNIEGPFAADSIFLRNYKNTLYISTYHDQALIPFKILNNASFNLTIGLNYRRLSPSHGTAKDIIFKNLANNSSYLECMKN